MADYFVHPTSIVDDGVEIGRDTRIWHFCHVTGPTTIGVECNIGQNVFVAGNVQIGRNVKIQNNVSVYEGVILEDDVFCGPSMVFTNVSTPRSFVSRKNEYRITRVKRGATIGANATIVCGVTIGAYAFVGAGSVVTHDVDSFALVYGNPARHHGWVCRCGDKLDLAEARAKCGRCKCEYELKGDRLRPWEKR